MANYQGQPAYGSFPPFYVPQQSPPAVNAMNYNNGYGSPNDYGYQQQFSPPAQALYGTGMEPATPVLDQNQMAYFWNEVQSGNIPTIPAIPNTVAPIQSYAPPPIPVQSYQPQYPYPPSGSHLSHALSVQQDNFQSQQNVQYDANWDAAMAQASKEDGEVSDGDEGLYEPPEFAIHKNNANGSTAFGYQHPAHIAQRPVNDAQGLQIPLANPFKRLSENQPPMTTKAQDHEAHTSTSNKAPQLNLTLKAQATNAVKEFHQHSIGYAELAREPVFDQVDKGLLKKLCAELGIPTASPPHFTTKPQDVQSDLNGKRHSNLQRLLPEAAVIDDHAIVAATNTIQSSQISKQSPALIPGLGAPTLVQQITQLSTESNATSSAPGGRSAYLAKLQAARNAKASPAMAPKKMSNVSTPDRNSQTSSTPLSSQRELPGHPSTTAPTSNKGVVKINRDVLQRKMQLQREALARQVQQAAERSSQPSLPTRTDSMSSVNYESGQISVHSTPAEEMQSSSPVEEDVSEDDSDDGEQSPALENSLTNPGLTSAGLGAQTSSHLRHNSKQLSHLVSSPQMQAARTSNQYPAAISSPSSWSPRNVQQDHSRKRPASSTSGLQQYNQAKRQHQHWQRQNDSNNTAINEPVIIDISSEDDASDGETIENTRTTRGIAAYSHNSLPPRPTQASRKEISNLPARPNWNTNPFSAFTTPPIINTPDPISARRQEAAAKQRAQLEAERRKLQQVIEQREREKTALSMTNLASPAARSQAQNNAICVSSIPQGASLSVPESRQAVLNALEADIRSDEAQMEALKQQMEKLQHDMARKSAEKIALAKELENFGVDTEGMSHAQMREVRDELVQEQDLERVNVANEEHKAATQLEVEIDDEEMGNEDELSESNDAESEVVGEAEDSTKVALKIQRPAPNISEPEDAPMHDADDDNDSDGDAMSVSVSNSSDEDGEIIEDQASVLLAEQAAADNDESSDSDGMEESDSEEENEVGQSPAIGGVFLQRVNVHAMDEDDDSDGSDSDSDTASESDDDEEEEEEAETDDSPVADVCADRQLLDEASDANGKQEVESDHAIVIEAKAAILPQAIQGPALGRLSHAQVESEITVPGIVTEEVQNNGASTTATITGRAHPISAASSNGSAADEEDEDDFYEPSLSAPPNAQSDSHDQQSNGAEDEVEDDGMGDLFEDGGSDSGSFALQAGSKFGDYEQTRKSQSRKIEEEEGAPAQPSDQMRADDQDEDYAPEVDAISEHGHTTNRHMDEETEQPEIPGVSCNVLNSAPAESQPAGFIPGLNAMDITSPNTDTSTNDQAGDDEAMFDVIPEVPTFSTRNTALTTAPTLVNESGIAAPPKDSTAMLSARKTYFKPYESALKGLKAFRHHSEFREQVSGGINSLTYSHQINPLQPLCPTEVAGYRCPDEKCVGQHWRDVSLREDQILKQISTVNNPGHTMEEKMRWDAGMRTVVEELRSIGVKDADTIARRITEFRREFFGGTIFEVGQEEELGRAAVMVATEPREDRAEPSEDGEIDE